VVGGHPEASSVLKMMVAVGPENPCGIFSGLLVRRGSIVERTSHRAALVSPFNRMRSDVIAMPVKWPGLSHEHQFRRVDSLR
jgi:hypothetical protein